MTYENIAVIVSIVSVLVVLSQSVILYVTIKKQIYQSFLSSIIEFNKVLMEHADLRKYLYDGEPVTDETENLPQLMTLIEMILDISENIELNTKNIPKSKRHGWQAYVEDFKKTPAYNYYISKQKYNNWFN